MIDNTTLAGEIRPAEFQDIGHQLECIAYDKISLPLDDRIIRLYDNPVNSHKSLVGLETLFNSLNNVEK